MRILYKIILSFLIISCICSCQEQKKTSKELKVMSFNIWVGGGNSIEATAEVFVKSGADIIGVQESKRDGKNTAVAIADSLGWHSYEFNDSQTIISKYPILDKSPSKYGVKIQLDENRTVWMFNVHFNHCPYEPYQLNGMEYCGAPLLETVDQVVASAWNTRKEEVELVISDILHVKKDHSPIFMTGDFNEPSYLDWTDKAQQAGLHKIAVAWPATKALSERASMKDSYRTIYPDEVKNPGYTWTPLPEKVNYTEVLDRIDFVLYQGEGVEVFASQIIGENSSSSDIKFDNYPSDHRAVISTFTLR